jgi:hypothetical protein
MTYTTRTNRLRKDRLPNPADFYPDELGKLSRPSHGWARGNCPFHESSSGTSFSVNLESGGFYCHGCAVKGGDIIAFVMLRDKCDFKSAARSLGCWDDALQVDAVVIRQVEIERERRAEQREAELELDRELAQRYDDAERALYSVEAIYRDANAQLSEIRSGRRSSNQQELYWSILSMAQSEVREAETEFVRARLAWPGAPFNKAARDYRERQSS